MFVLGDHIMKNQDRNTGQGEHENRDELRRQLAAAQARCTSLEEELAQSRKDRDEYERAVHFLTQREFAITRRIVYVRRCRLFG
jgi:hypothetical protein